MNVSIELNRSPIDSLARLSADLELPLLDHLIIAGDQMTSCGYF